MSTSGSPTALGRMGSIATDDGSSTHGSPSSIFTRNALLRTVNQAAELVASDPDRWPDLAALLRPYINLAERTSSPRERRVGQQTPARIDADIDVLVKQLRVEPTPRKSETKADHAVAETKSGAADDTEALPPLPAGPLRARHDSEELLGIPRTFSGMSVPSYNGSVSGMLNEAEALLAGLNTSGPIAEAGETAGGKEEEG